MLCTIVTHNIRLINCWNDYFIEQNTANIESPSQPSPKIFEESFKMYFLSAFSRLGDGDRAVRDQLVEVKLPQESDVKGSDTDVDINIAGVACGSRHSFIWTQTGQAYSFGNNFYAQLGYDFQRADFKEHQVWRL